MKLKLCIVMSCLLTFLSSAIQAGIVGNVAGIPERWLVKKIEKKGRKVFGIKKDDVGKFKPRKGGIKVCKEENKLIVGFYLTQGSIDFYSQKFSDDSRMLIGLELDVIDLSDLFSHDDLEKITVSTNKGNNLPVRAFYRDNPICDTHTSHTVGIYNPSLLTPNQWYYVTFKFSKHNEDVDIAHFKMQIQLVGDMYRLREEQEDLFNEFPEYIKTGLNAWLALYGSDISKANRTFNIVSPHTEFDVDKFFADDGYDRFLWNRDKNRKPKEGQIGDYSPGYCAFGEDPWAIQPVNNGGSENTVSVDVENGVDLEECPNCNNSTGNTGNRNPRPQPTATIKKLKASKGGENNYHKSIDLKYSELESVDVKLKLVRNRQWPSKICANLYFSKDKEFITENDEYVKKECESFRQRKKKGSIYFDNLDLTEYFKEVDKGYLFAEYSLNGQSFISSNESKYKQYVRINVTKPFHGYFDKATCDEFGGWVVYNESLNEPTDVHVYIDGDFFIGMPADLLREDLSSLYKEGTSLNHGFSIETPDFLKDGESHEVRVYGYNPITGESQELINSPRTISNCSHALLILNPVVADIIDDKGNGDSENSNTNDSGNSEPEPTPEPTEPDNHLPEGWVDKATCTIEGWARDADTINPIWIHFYINGNYAGAAKADLPRTDLSTLYGDDIYHGYIYEIPPEYRNGKYEFRAFGINNLEDSSRNPELQYTPAVNEEGGLHYFECY